MTSIATAGFGLLQYVERSLFLGLGIVLRVWQGTGAAFSETAGTAAWFPPPCMLYFKYLPPQGSTSSLLPFRRKLQGH